MESLAERQSHDSAGEQYPPDRDPSFTQANHRLAKPPRLTSQPARWGNCLSNLLNLFLDDLLRGACPTRVFLVTTSSPPQPASVLWGERHHTARHLHPSLEIDPLPPLLNVLYTCSQSPYRQHGQRSSRSSQLPSLEPTHDIRLNVERAVLDFPRSVVRHLKGKPAQDLCRDFVNLGQSELCTVSKCLVHGHVWSHLPACPRKFVSQHPMPG